MKLLATTLTARRAILAMVVGIALSMPASAIDYRDRLPEDEVVYFVLPDRFENGDRSNDLGGLQGDPLHTGFDPQALDFYHGGDLRGIQARLDYIAGLGATAIWLAPVFRNKPVQYYRGKPGAGYHGYWITDFTHVDPHFGSDEDFARLVTAAHARGIKVYMDIVVNHTADVIQYRECPAGGCPYRSKADYPYQRRGGVSGEAINPGFLGDDAAHQNAENFSHLTRPDYAYTPFVPAEEINSKVPAWLNDPIYYHNRGESTFKGENSTYGDFGGLDDLMTENPRVLAGFIEIYGGWIDKYGIDGFRIDTAKHVNPEFFRGFVRAMLQRAAARGIPHFHIFGEVANDKPDAGFLARYQRAEALPAVLDFAFAVAVQQVVGGHAATEVLGRVFADDVLYEGGERAALQLPTFTGNHDDGRFAWKVGKALPEADSNELMQRVILANAMLLTLRGVPVLYYGDEQGFVGSGKDKAARQDMFVTQVPAFQKESRLGPPHAPTTDSFDMTHPLYREIARLAQLRRTEPALRRGLQVVRAESPQPGIFAVSRFDPESSREVVIAFNTSMNAIEERIEVSSASQQFVALAGNCAERADAPGSYQLVLAPLSYSVCAASQKPGP